MIFCNIFETLPATLIVFKMIDSVPQWQPQARRSYYGCRECADPHIVAAGTPPLIRQG